LKTPDLDTSWRPLANNTSLCRHLKAKKITLFTILLGVEDQSITQTLCIILKSLALIHKGTTRLPCICKDYNNCSQGLGLPLVIFSIGGGDSKHFGPMCLLFLPAVQGASSCLRHGSSFQAYVTPIDLVKSKRDSSKWKHLI